MYIVDTNMTNGYTFIIHNVGITRFINSIFTLQRDVEYIYRISGRHFDCFINEFHRHHRIINKCVVDLQSNRKIFSVRTSMVNSFY